MLVPTTLPKKRPLERETKQKPLTTIRTASRYLDRTLALLARVELLLIAVTVIMFPVITLLAYWLLSWLTFVSLCRWLLAHWWLSLALFAPIILPPIHRFLERLQRIDIAGVGASAETKARKESPNPTEDGK